MNAVVKVPASLEKISTMKDGSVRITLESQELNSQSCADLLALRQCLGWFIFCSYSSTKEIEIPEEAPTNSREEKSPSQQMRGIIYRIWEQTTDRKTPWPDFYKSYMWQLNERLKEKLS